MFTVMPLPTQMNGWLWNPLDSVETSASGQWYFTSRPEPLGIGWLALGDSGDPDAHRVAIWIADRPEGAAHRIVTVPSGLIRHRSLGLAVAWLQSGAQPRLPAADSLFCRRNILREDRNRRNGFTLFGFGRYTGRYIRLVRT